MHMNAVRKNSVSSATLELVRALARGERNPVEILGIDLAECFARKPLDERPGWATTPMSREQQIRDFTKFFLLAAVCPDAPLAPTAMMDDVWHEFMLHPVAYNRACMQHAGVIIDHNGGFGNGAGEMPILEEHFNQTKTLWRQVLGEPHPHDRSACDATNCVRCNVACQRTPPTK
jgi:hypothetical protein